GGIPYSVVTLRQFVAAYLVVSLLVAAYEVIRNDYERLAECTAREITSANQRLSVEVNERRRAQEAMQAATEEAKRANLAKSAFLSRMSHEFRTPMNSILGFSQLMESDTREPLPEAHRRSVQEILNSGRHLLELINEVLDLARIEAGRVTLSIETVALAPLVRETIATVKPLAEARRITINVRHQDGELFVRADPTRLRQVLLNLLSNAIKYNRDAGQIRVETRRAESCVAEIHVTDTGYGIPEEKQTLVFAPFERLAQTDSGTEGSGIGLAISRQLVSLMQGSITFTSTPGLGTCFAVTLPVSPRPSGANDATSVPAPLESGQATAAVPPGTGTVLYVEDDLTNLALVRQILMRRPLLRLLHAADGAAGIAMARAHAPDLVLLDIRLPDMSGVEVLRAIRSDPTTLRLPVVVVTASAMPHEMKALENADIARCLTKPLDVMEFLETVDMVLSAPGPERRQVTDAPV
ncbi:MAG: ATP-binding protein, partial [Candidatus Eisenbacteria bacterium]|nr:ATP-binding protein [Candidatus Eisenbacteria bacterium]